MADKLIRTTLFYSKECTTLPIRHIVQLYLIIQFQISTGMDFKLPFDILRDSLRQYL